MGGGGKTYVLNSQNLSPWESNIRKDCVLRITFLSVNEEGELGRISEEENRCVVVDPVPVTFVGVKLN